MYLWRSLPQSQLSAVMTWLFSRRQPAAPAASRQKAEPRTVPLD